MLLIALRRPHIPLSMIFLPKARKFPWKVHQLWNYSFKSVLSKKVCRKPSCAILTAPVFGVIALNKISHKTYLQEKHMTQVITSSLRSWSDYLTFPVFYLVGHILSLVLTFFYLTKLTLRFTFLSMTFGPLVLCYPLAFYSETAKKMWLNALLKLVMISGPTIVKLGQWASTRRDLFSPQFCDILGLLHHDAACHSWACSKETLERVFGSDWEEWCTIEFKHPVHSGCIGQVYKGYIDMDTLKARKELCPKLSPDQEGGCHGKVVVAIKVLHPGVMEAVELDLTLMKFVAKLISTLPGVEWLSFPEIIMEFEKLMKNQIDLRIEAENLDVFNDFFSSDPTVKFPCPIWPLVHTEVLFETFEEGIPIGHFINSEKAAQISSHLKKHLAKLGISAILKMVFVNNFVHADLHPGNIIVQYRSEEALSPEEISEMMADTDVTLSKIQLVFLDAGIIASLNEKDLENLHGVFKNIVTNRGDIVGELFLKHATTNKCSRPEEFIQAMAELINSIHKMTLHLGKVQVANLLSDLFNMLMKHKVKLESNFSSVLLAIMILEGLGRSLDPQLDILQEAKPVLLNRVLRRARIA